MMRFGINEPWTKAFSNAKRELCFYCNQPAVIPGDPGSGHAKDYILIHVMNDGEECPMSELQKDLDQVNAYEKAMQDEEYEYETDIPLD